MSGLSLDCLTLPDVAPVDLLRIAGKAGYRSVSLWVQEPTLYPIMLATTNNQANIARAMEDHGVSLGNLEVFNLNIEEPMEVYEPALRFGAELGAQSATAIDYGTVRPDISERLATFHALCAGLGLKTFVEPISMGATRTLQDGAELISAAGVDARLVVDFIHLVRTGGTADSLAAIAPQLIGYVQLCDGPDTITADELGIEAASNRLYPGEGDFPLSDFLKALPIGVQFGIEAPNLDRLQRGVSPLERAKETFALAQAVLAKAGRAA